MATPLDKFRLEYDLTPVLNKKHVMLLESLVPYLTSTFMYEENVLAPMGVIGVTRLSRYLIAAIQSDFRSCPNLSLSIINGLDLALEKAYKTKAMGRASMLMRLLTTIKIIRREYLYYLNNADRADDDFADATPFLTGTKLKYLIEMTAFVQNKYDLVRPKKDNDYNDLDPHNEPIISW